MTKRLLLLTAAIFFIHCNEDESLDPPKIAIDMTAAWAGMRSIDAEKPNRFNLYIRNEGEQTLKISSAKIKGDQNCAFTKEGPDQKELGENGSAFIRISYKPTVRAEDNISLIINSNSEKNKKLTVPICGIGVLPEELPDESDTESSDDDSIDRICDVPPADQPDCEAVDTEGE